MNHNPKSPGISRIALGAAGLCLIGQAVLPQPAVAAGGDTTTPIEHVVVILVAGRGLRASQPKRVDRVCPVRRIQGIGICGQQHPVRLAINQGS